MLKCMTSQGAATKTIKTKKENRAIKNKAGPPYGKLQRYWGSQNAAGLNCSEDAAGLFCSEKTVRAQVALLCCIRDGRFLVPGCGMVVPTNDDLCRAVWAHDGEQPLAAIQNLTSRI